MRSCSTGFAPRGGFFGRGTRNIAPGAVPIKSADPARPACTMTVRGGRGEMANTQFDFTGKVALVTGGASLLGATIVRAFHTAGAVVVVADVDEARGTAGTEPLGERALFVRTDITEDAELVALTGAAQKRYGGVDFLINSAVTFQDNGLASTREEWWRALNVNVASGAILTRMLAPMMKARGGGAVVNFSSIAGKFANAGR